VLYCDCIQRVLASLISSSVTRLVCVYQHTTDAMAATSAETRPTNSTAVSHAQISLDLRDIGNGSVPIQLAYIYLYTKYTEAILLNSTRKLLWCEINKMLIAV